MEVSSASPLLTDSEEFSESGVDGKTPSAGRFSRLTFCTGNEMFVFTNFDIAYAPQ